MNHLVQDEYIQMLIDVAHGLMLIHQHPAIHRDIKPENIIYSKGIFKITDFGTSIQNAKTNQMAGTCLYWAPELLFDEVEQYTQAVDIWSFGVMAFQAYFLIHPFFYNKQIKTNKQAIAQIKRNIEAITPNFTFDKLLIHLRKLGYNDKADFIENKLLQTHPELKATFQGFFVRNPKNRQQLGYLIAKLQSIQDYVIKHVQVKSSKIVSKQRLPPDVSIYISAMNLFYKLNHDFMCKMHEDVQFHLQLALRIISIQQHDKKQFIEFRNKQKINKLNLSKSKSKQYYQKIRSVLSEYYFYLKQSNEILFFQQLPKLRTLICFCSCWLMIREQFKNFIKKVEYITHIPIRSLQEFEQLIPALTEKQLVTIENYILCEFFC